MFIMNRKLIPALLSAIVFMLTACSEPPEEFPETAAGPDTILVSPALTIGIMMGDSNYVFGTISDAVELDDGSIAILDEASCCSKLYTAQGEFMTQVSRRGSGPGEVVMPGGLVKLSDGTLAILDHATGIHRFDPSGEFLEFMIDFQGQDVPQWAWGVNDMGIVGAITQMQMVDDVLTVNFIVGRWDSEPAHTVEYFRNSFPFNPERMDEFFSNTFFSTAFTASEDGTTFIAPISSEQYEIQIYNPDGTLCGTIQREMDPVPKTPEEVADETALITAILKERGVPEDHIRYQPDPDRWMIQPQGIGTDGQGRLWVRNGLTDLVIMDVYSRDGEHLAVVQFQGVTDPEILDYLNIKIQQNRILIYSLQDPDYPRLYAVDMPEIS